MHFNLASSTQDLPIFFPSTFPYLFLHLAMKRAIASSTALQMSNTMTGRKICKIHERNEKKIEKNPLCSTLTLFSADYFIQQIFLVSGFDTQFYKLKAPHKMKKPTPQKQLWILLQMKIH